MVRKGMGSDSRIGRSFCILVVVMEVVVFPKDIRAIIKIGEEAGYEMKVIKAVEEVNNIQKSILFKKF